MINAEKFKCELSAIGAHFALLKYGTQWKPYPCDKVHDCNVCLFHQYREGVPPHKAMNCYDGRFTWMMQEAE